MNALPYYKRFPREFFDKTFALPLELKGAYSVLVDIYYLNDGCLPSDQIIAEQLGCGVRKWRKIKQYFLIYGYLYYKGGLKLELVRDWNKPQTRPALPLNLRIFILERDNYTCVYCGTTEPPFEVDHVVPYSKNGGHTEENLVCACRRCNRSKGAKTLTEWGLGQ